MAVSHVRGGEQGFALIAVLGFLMLMAIFLTPFVTSARLEALLSNNRLQNSRLEGDAEALNQYSIRRLSADPAWKARVNRAEIDRLACRSAHALIEISIIPHGRLININTADAALLNDGLIRLDIDPVEAPVLAAKIMAYRAPLGGVSADDAVLYDLKRAPFEDVSELYDFKRLQGIPMSSLLRVFSVWSGRSMLTRIEGTATISQHYTAITQISTASANGQAAAVYRVGGKSVSGEMISPIVEYIENSRTPIIRPCDALFGPNAQLILEEAGL